MQRVAGRPQTWTVVLGGTTAGGSSEPADRGLRPALDLALSMTDLGHVVTTLAPGEPVDAPPAAPALRRGRPLYEPADRGTACSRLLALGHIQAADPDARIIVLPTGCRVDPALAFGAHLLATLDLATRIDRVVTLGVATTLAGTRDGWIQPGSPTARVGRLELRRVETFLEGPCPEQASLILATGGVRSTMIFAGTLGRLRALMRRSLPDVATAFDPLVDVAGTPRERPWLEALYAGLPRRTIEAHVLTGTGDDLAVAELGDVSLHMLEMLRGAGSLPVHVSTPRPDTRGSGTEYRYRDCSASMAWKRRSCAATWAR